MFSIRFWTFLEEVLILQVYNYHEIADNVIDKLQVLVIGITDAPFKNIPARLSSPAAYTFFL